MAKRPFRQARSGLRKRIGTSWIPVVLVAAMAQAGAATVEVIGPPGSNGTSGTTPGQAGAAGGNGGDANALSAPATGVSNLTRGKGGNGGMGGWGANGGGSTPGGNAADAGNGGNAGATANAQPLSGHARAESVADGGHGGRAGTPGNPGGNGANGGNGGWAASTAAARAAGASNAEAIATAAGGSGGAGIGAGKSGGMGGMATVSRAEGHSATGNVEVRSTIDGGSGGRGESGANGGAGAQAESINAVSGSTAGALRLLQSVSGGWGGASDSGLAGTGGSALSVLSLEDHVASSVLTSASAQGGNSGSTVNGLAADGADGTARSELIGTGALTSDAYASGGGGGGAFSNLSPSGGNGGNAFADVKVSSSLHSALGFARADGGAGGVHTAGRLGGVHGNAHASSWVSGKESVQAQSTASIYRAEFLSGGSATAISHAIAIERGTYTLAKSIADGEIAHATATAQNLVDPSGLQSPRAYAQIGRVRSGQATANSLTEHSSGVPAVRARAAVSVTDATVDPRPEGMDNRFLAQTYSSVGRAIPYWLEHDIYETDAGSHAVYLPQVTAGELHPTLQEAGVHALGGGLMLLKYRGDALNHPGTFDRRTVETQAVFDLHVAEGQTALIDFLNFSWEPFFGLPVGTLDFHVKNAGAELLSMSFDNASEAISFFRGAPLLFPELSGDVELEISLRMVADNTQTAELRYLVGVVPEPSTWLLLIAGLLTWAVSTGRWGRTAVLSGRPCSA